MNNDQNANQLSYLKQLFAGEDEHCFDQKLVDFFPAIIYIYDTSNKQLRYINKRITDVLGYSYEDVQSWDKNFMQVVYIDDVEVVQKELEKFYTLQNEEQYSYKSRLTHKCGDWRYFRTIGTVLRRDDSGNAASLLFIAQDISHEIQSAEELEQTKSLIEETERMLNYGTYHLMTDSKKVSWSNGLYELFELDKQAFPVVGLDLFLEQLVVEEDRERVETLVNNVILNGEEFEIEYNIVTHATKTEKIIVSNGKMIRDVNGNPVKIIGSARDVTKMRHYERELQKHVIELNRSNKELEEFAYVASHDLQEPLRKISTFGGRLQTKFADVLGDDGKTYLNRIMISAESMRLLIDNLLEFSRITRVTHPFVITDISKITEEAIADLELKIEETGAVIHVHKLPCIEAIPLQMKQLFTNLLSNALKFYVPGRPPVIVINSHKLTKLEKEDYHLAIDKAYYAIQVKDNGIGFEPEYAERIFQIFQRLHGKADYAGSGVGLAICKKITDHHNGLIYAESKLNSGSVFTIILPEKQ